MLDGIVIDSSANVLGELGLMQFCYVVETLAYTFSTPECFPRLCQSYFLCLNLSEVLGGPPSCHLRLWVSSRQLTKGRGTVELPILSHPIFRQATRNPVSVEISKKCTTTEHGIDSLRGLSLMGLENCLLWLRVIPGSRGQRRS